MQDVPRAPIVPVLILLATAAILLPSLRIPFVNDDLTVISYAFTDWKPDPMKLVSRQEVVDLYYRPIIDLTFALDYLVWGWNALGYRLTNLLIHLVDTLLVYYLARRLLKNETAAAVGALLFGVLPIHETSILWVPGRTDMVCCVFYLLTIHLWLTHLERGTMASMIGSLATGLLAMLSKEMAMSLPLTIMLTTAWHFYGAVEPVKVRAVLRSGIPFLLLVVGVFVARALLLDNNILTSQQGLHGHADLLSIVRNVASYIGLLIVPAGHYALERLVTEYPSLFIASAAALLVGGGLLLWRFRRAATPLVLAALWVLLTLIPVSRLAMRWYLYIPSVGFCIALGWLIDRFGRDRFGRLATTAAIIWFGYSAITLASTVEWIAAGQIGDRLVEDLQHKIDRNPGKDTLVFLTTLAKIRTVPVFHLGLEKMLQFALRDDSLTVLILSRVVMDEYPDTIRWEWHPGERPSAEIETGDRAYLLLSDPSLLTRRDVATPGYTIDLAATEIEVTGVDAYNKPSRIRLSPRLPSGSQVFIFDGENIVRVE